METHMSEIAEQRRRHVHNVWHCDGDCPVAEKQTQILKPFLIDESLATSSCCELLPYLHRDKIAQEIKTKEAWRQIAQENIDVSLLLR